jgi:hypothetical protein
VAVDADFSSVSQTHLKDVHDVHHVSKRSWGHVFPTLAEAADSVLVEMLRNVTEAYFWNNTISAVWMLNNFNFTSPGYCRLSTVRILISLNLAKRLYSLMSLVEGRCIARMSSVIQLECSPSMALGSLLLVL